MEKVFVYVVVSFAVAIVAGLVAGFVSWLSERKNKAKG